MPLFSRLEDAVDALAKGQVIIVADAEERENEGDFLVAAEKATSETIHFLISEGRGQLCMPVVPSIARRLGLKPMVPRRNLSMPCFAVPVDYRDCKTGISPSERALTIRKMVDDSTRADDFVRPGHVFPLIACEGGVLEREGHTEATIDLVRLAGLRGAGVLCEICSRDREHMATGPELDEIARTFRLPIVSIDELIRYRRKANGSARAVPTPKSVAAAGKAKRVGPNGAGRSHRRATGCLPKAPHDLSGSLQPKSHPRFGTEPGK